MVQRRTWRLFAIGSTLWLLGQAGFSIDNGTFTYGIDPWERIDFDGPASGNLAWEMVAGHDGLGSLRIEATDSDFTFYAASECLWSGAPGNQTWTISGWVDEDSSGCFVDFIGWANSLCEGQPVGGPGFTTTTTGPVDGDWLRRELSFDFGSSEIGLRAVVYAVPETPNNGFPFSGTCRFDDIVVAGPPTPAAIPTLAPVGLIVLIASILGFGVWFVRGRNHPERGDLERPGVIRR